MPNANIFDSISTGDIDILGGGIANQGIGGKDLAAIFQAQAQVDMLQAAREREDKAKRTKIIIISGSVVLSLVLILSLLYYSTKN